MLGMQCAYVLDFLGHPDFRNYVPGLAYISSSFNMGLVNYSHSNDTAITHKALNAQITQNLLSKSLLLLTRTLLSSVKQLIP